MVQYSLILFIILPLCVYSTCHYSCIQCATQQYTYCTKCIDGQLIIIEDPQIIPIQYHNSRKQTGICSQFQQFQQLNIFGMILVILSIIFLPIANTNKLFYIISTLQSLGLVSFIEIYWGNVLGYQLSGLQYYMPFNFMSRSFKEETIQFKKSSYYYFDLYFKEADVLMSLSIVGIIDIIVFVLLIVVPIFMVMKKKHCADSCRVFILADWFLTKAAKILIVIYFFLIQQTVLSIIASFFFQQSSLTPTIIISVFYFLSLIIYSMLTFKLKNPYFYNRFTQYQTMSKKIIYPIFLIIPIEYHYILLIMMLIKTLLECLFDYFNRTQLMKSRYTIYRVTELLINVMLLIYYFVERDTNQKLASEIVGGIAVGLVNLYVVWFVLEVVMGIRERINKKDKDDKEKKIMILPPVSSENKQYTMQNIQEIQMIQQVTQSDINDRQLSQAERNLNRTLKDSSDKPQKPSTQQQNKGQHIQVHNISSFDIESQQKNQVEQEIIKKMNKKQKDQLKERNKLKREKLAKIYLGN